MERIKLVAEIGINHNGDMGIIHTLMVEAKEAGFDYVKFQKRNIHVTTPPEKKQQMKDTPWGRIPYIDYKRRLEDIDYDQIDKWSHEMDIPWFASPWDVDSVKFLQQYDCPFIKVASALVTDEAVLMAIQKTGILVILSTGMSNENEVKKALDILDKSNVEYIMGCTSTYPTPTAEMNMSFLWTLKELYPWSQIGFSNHHPGILHAATSVIYGAKMIEAHVTLDRSMFGSDQASSIEPEGMHKLRKYVDGIQEAHGTGQWITFPSELKVAKSLRWKEYSNES